MEKSRNMHEGILAEIQAGRTLVIYGAGLMGRQLKKILADKPYCCRVSYFIVESLDGNPGKIDDTPVIELKNAGFLKEYCILAALHEKSMGGALKELRAAGFEKLVPVSFDSDIWCELRKNHIQSGGTGPADFYLDFEEELRNYLHVYVAKSVYDRKLGQDEALTSCEIPIQVGAALTDQKICEVRDNQGDNISHLNRQYCELTALYWIWKHDNAKYTGLSHYRRRFMLDSRQTALLGTSNVDVMLTVPVCNFNTVRGQYGVDHERKDWEIMMSAIAEIYPEYAPAARLVQDGEWYYAYNMMIARKEILNEYCAWLFPILSYCTEKIGEKADPYQNRYPGFLAERLMTVFFEHNRPRYKIAVGEKYFLEED